jgi:hypothetical protein
MGAYEVDLRRSMAIFLFRNCDALGHGDVDVSLL